MYNFTLLKEHFKEPFIKYGSIVTYENIDVYRVRLITWREVNT